MAGARRSRRGAAALFTATVLWIGVLIAAPIIAAEAAGRQPGSLAFRAAGTIYLFGRVICHQRPERSFHWDDVQLPVCARCFGLYAGAVLGAGIGWSAALRRGRCDRNPVGFTLLTSCKPSRRPTSDIETLHRARLVLAAAALPTLASLGLELGGIVVGSKSVRALAAVPLGAAVAWVVSSVIGGKLR